MGSEFELYVTGIPLDLDQTGLQNLFAAAGPVERAKIFPPKSTLHSTSYGFVSFKTKSAAATALNMFRNYKIGSHVLKCDYSKSESGGGDRDRALPPLPPSSFSANPDFKPRQPTGQQRDMNAFDDNNQDIDLTKHYAQAYMKRRNSNTAYSAPVETESRVSSVKSPVERTISKPNQNGHSDRDSNYREADKENRHSTHQPEPQSLPPTKPVRKSPNEQVESESTCSNARIEILEMLNSLNEKSTRKNLKINQNDLLEIGRFYPIKITHVITPSNFFVQLKSSEKKTGNVMNNVNNCYINEDIQQFCDTEKSSIRCKLAGIKPINGSTSWNPSSIQILENLNKFSLELKVVGKEEFEPASGRFEYIYSVDVILNQNDSLIQILVECGCASQIETDTQPDGDRPSSRVLSRKPSSSYDQSETDNEVSNINAKLEKKVQITKMYQPEPARLRLTDIPAMDIPKTLADPENTFFLFPQRINMFYAMNPATVQEIQEKVDVVCQKIIEDSAKYDPIDESDLELSRKYLPEKGNLVYANYHEDDQWYRCVVTNCSQEKRKYEVFFIDFGNTEVYQGDKLLMGWKDDHLSLFHEFEPQAIKCKLFGVRPVGKEEFSNEDNAYFKDLVTDRLFVIDLLKHNQDDKICEINLHEVIDSGHAENLVIRDLLSNGTVEFPKLNQLIPSISTKEQLDFYVNLLSKLSPLAQG